MNIKILGSGCANCKRLMKNAEKAVRDLGIDATIEKVEDYQKIMSYGVLSTPALVVDDEVKIYGRVPSPHEIGLHLK